MVEPYHTITICPSKALTEVQITELQDRGGLRWPVSLNE